MEIPEESMLVRETVWKAESGEDRNDVGKWSMDWRNFN